MKLILKSVVLLLLPASFLYSQEMRSRENKTGIAVDIRIIRCDQRELVLALVLRNDSGRAIFFATDPVRADGSKGYYVSSENGSIKIESRVFGPYQPSPYSPRTSVRLAKLNSSQQFRESISLRWPISETVPPVDFQIDSKKIERNQPKTIKLNIGYFWEEEGILEFLQRKQSGWDITGLESLVAGLNKGKRFYELQNIATISGTLEPVE